MASEMMQEQMKCPICRNVLKKPIRILTCGHNLCHGCLEVLIASSRPNSCPICWRAIDHTISIEDFPRNHMVENMIEKIDHSSVTPIVNVVQKVKVLSGHAMKQLTEIAKSHEQKGQFHEAVNTWRDIIGHCQHINKILPTTSIITCFLKIGELNKAAISTVELLSLLESTAGIQTIKDECDFGICNLAKNFLKFEQFDLIFQLLQCRFNLLQQHYKGEAMLQRMRSIGVLMGDVAKIIKNPTEIELFKKQYKFLDNILVFMQNTPANNSKIMKTKCKHVSSFLNSYGYCCNQMEDYLKAIGFLNQAIGSTKLVLGDESNHYVHFALSFNNLGWALEHSNHLAEAKTAYHTSMELYVKVRDCKNEEERKAMVLRVGNHMERVKAKLRNV